MHENNGNILTGRGQVQSQSEQAQSHGQVQSRSERAQFGSGQVQSHGQAQSHGQVQSNASSMAVQILKNKNKPREEIKPVNKERQKIELEKSIRRFNQINEEIKELHDKQVTKLKQQEEDMHESLRKVEAKYFPDLGSDKDKDVDSDKDNDLDLDSFDDFVYVQKPKTNSIRCEECDEEMFSKEL